MFMHQRMNILGALLISVGALAILDFLIPHLLNRFWPVLLIVAGGYLLMSYYRKGGLPQAKTSYRTPPPSAIPPNLDAGASDFASNQYRER